jgi:hypothetical protein
MAMTQSRWQMWASILFALLTASLASADGGTIRVSEKCSNYRVTVFTSPTILRAGTVDVSVLVQDPSTGDPILDVEIDIVLVLRGNGAIATQHATSEAATNKLYRAAAFDLPAPGEYTFCVAVAGERGDAQVSFDVEAAEALPHWLILWPWFGWPALIILLFGIHKWLAKDRTVPRSWIQRSSQQLRLPLARVY